MLDVSVLFLESELVQSRVRPRVARPRLHLIPCVCICILKLLSPHIPTSDTSLTVCKKVDRASFDRQEIIRCSQLASTVLTERMAPPRPSSPTSLLWAHQLKREHSYLLKRVQDLESSNKAHEDRIKTAEAAGKAVASGEIASLAKQIKDLEDIGLSKCVDAMEDDVPRKIDDVQADSEALTMQLAALQKDDLVAREEKKKSLNKDKALLNRIGEVEEGLKKYERGLELVGRKVNDQQISAIKEQLDGLTKRVMKEGSQMKLLVESIQQLEQAHDELRKANQGLEEQLRKRSDEPVERPKQAINRPSTVEDDASEGATPEVTTGRKKNHKWSGGGADRDIVKMGTTLFGDRLPKASAPKKDAAPRKAPIVPPKKPKPRKGPVPKAPLTPGVRKSHKWGGGGADRDIVAAGLSGDEGRKRKRSAEVEPEPPKSKAGKAVAGKAIVRSGRGWYEVVDSESPEQEGDR